MDEEKEYKVHWSLQGSYILKAKNQSDAVDEAFKKQDKSDPKATYTINQVRCLEKKR